MRLDQQSDPDDRSGGRDTAMMLKDQRRVDCGFGSPRFIIGPGVQLADVCEMQHAIIENAGYAIIATDCDGAVIYFNRGAQKMLGYRWEEVVGRCTPIAFHDPDEILEFACRRGIRFGSPVTPDFSALAIALEAEQQIEEQFTYIRKDGSQLPVNLLLTPLHDTAGALQGYLGIAADISERLQIEHELRIAATAFESQAAIMVTDAGQRILRINPAFSRLTGYSAAEAIGQQPTLLKSGRQDAAFYDRMWQSLNESGHWQGEIWNRRKCGEVFPEWLTISAIHDERGKLTHYVSTFSDISNLKLAETEIHNLAYFDPLTALPNRRLLLNRLGQAQATGNRKQKYGALMIIDLDNFKTLNDTLGHDAGDRLLIDVARRLTDCLREGDTAARQGGDEFAVLLDDLGIDPDAAAVQAEIVAEKIREALGQPYVLAGNSEHFHTASIGVSLFCGHDKPLEMLLKQADIALYKAKDAGRNAIRFFDSAMQTALDFRAALENGLRHALSRDEFVLHVQAQVNSRRELIGAETLLRWQALNQALLAPGEFIPLAEETGLIVPIGLWVLDRACARLHAWAGNPLTRDLYLAVNVSARQFRQPDFVDQVRSALERHGARPDRLKLELTESLLLDNVDDVVLKMQALRNIGVRFSLDDFGTGYASLSYLKRFPFEQLKVDRSFIRDVSVDPDDAAIVSAIIAMGNSLRLSVVAEGVETEEQHAFLVGNGCQGFQGYLFGRPMPFADFEAQVEDGFGNPGDNWVI